MGKKIYIAGPMSGIPNFNYPAFNEAAAVLRDKGWTVFNPAERDIERHGGVDISVGNDNGCVDQAAAEHGFSRRVALAEDLDWIARNADAIAMLPRWRWSSGACAEVALALALGLETYHIMWLATDEGKLPLITQVEPTLDMFRAA